MLRVFLNSYLCEDASGLDVITDEIKLSEEFKGYVTQVQGSMTLLGADYEFIRALYDSQYCQDIEIDIQRSEDNGNSWFSESKGLIRFSGVKWDRKKDQAECPIIDNSFLSKLNNNRNTEFTLGVYHGTLLSKNGVDVSAKAIYYSDIQMFSPMTGRSFAAEAFYNKSNPPFPASEGDDLVDMRPTGRVGIFIWDALNLIIAMMSDNQVEFESSFFDYNLGAPLDTRAEAFSMIFSGQHLRHGSGYPTISFDQFFGDLHRLCNVYFSLEISNTGNPVIRIENEAYFKQQNSNYYFESIDSLIESIDLSRIYSRVKVGCSHSSGNFPIGEIKLVNHIQEEFPLSGTCNVDKTLDLQLQKLIINTNTIAAALPSISGFANGGSVIRKYSTEQTTAGPNQKITDSTADFKVHGVGIGWIITNTVENTWSYITGVPDNDNILIEDEIFIVDNTGLTKSYEIFKPTEDDSLFDEVFLIQLDREIYDATSIFIAHPITINPPGDKLYYNDTFSNSNVITRHMGGVAQSIVNSLSNGNDEFAAVLEKDVGNNNTTYLLTTTQGNYKRVRFDDDVNSPYFDTNGNYDALTGIYTAPQPGYYHASVALKFHNAGTQDYIQQVELLSITANGDVLESESSLTTISNGTNFTFNLDRVFYLDQGDTIQVWIKKRFGLAGLFLNQYIDWTLDNPGVYGFAAADTDTNIFQVDALFNGGGLVPASTPADVRIVIVDMELSTTKEDFDQIKAFPFRYYHFHYGDNKYISGFIESVSREKLSGNTTMRIIKKKNGV